MSSAATSEGPVRRRVEAGLARRYRREFLFRAGGLLATLVGLGFLLLFFSSLLVQGASAFVQTQLALEVELDADLLGIADASGVDAADFDAAVMTALRDQLGVDNSRESRRALNRLLSIDASFQLRDTVRANPGLIGQTVDVSVPASSLVDMLVKDQIDRNTDESVRALSDQQIEWIDSLHADGRVQSTFNTAFFVNGDSREPELAGIRSALVGSFYMLAVTILLAFPIGVMAAIYLEEFAPRNRWADLVEVSINNLAAVPSIVFGLLGLAVFIDWLSLPRSAPLVGGLVLALLTLPVIIISGRAAIKSVPLSIREGASALGASRIQVVSHHVLPLALPGILTGAIIGMSRALGETAPLLMIGMVAFIVDVPAGLSDPATALPVQIFLWAESPERAFAEKTAAAIIVLLGFLLLMNLAAVLLRKRMEKRL